MPERGYLFIGASANILFEAAIRLFEEFRCHRQVALGCTQIDMAKIGGQSRKQTLHILILSVPRRHAMNRERVPQVVKPWLIGRFIVTRDARDPSQANDEGSDLQQSDQV